jgi:hypothetical protein
MKDYEISNSLDWNRVRTMLVRSKKSVPMFSFDVDKMIKSIDKEIAVLGNLEVLVRNKKTQGAVDRAQSQLDMINTRIKQFNKYYMIALLSHN